MTIIEKINECLNNKDLQKLLEVKDYISFFANDWFYLFEKKKKILEKMLVLTEDGSTNRIRFKGNNIAFSLGKDPMEKFYLDHLLLGDIKNEEFIFSLRHQYLENDEVIAVKLVDNGILHTFNISRNSLSIEKTYAKEIDYTNYNKDEEVTYETQIFNLKKENNEIKVWNNIDNKEHEQDIMKEFQILENFYPTITSYISGYLPFLSECIINTKNIQKEKTKIYKIKRKTTNN